MPRRPAFALRLLSSLFAAVTLAVLPSNSAPVQITPALAAGGAWLDHFNAWRTATGLSPVVENPVYSSGDYNHAVYMVKNDLVTHYETPGVPYYTADGDAAARNSNIFVSSTTSTSDVQAIDWWLGAPFHAMAMMDPRLTVTGFGSYREAKSGWQMAAAVDVVRGNSFTGGTFPVFWPANGSTEPLTQYSGNEFPDPLQACPGYSTPVGLPVFVEVGANVSTTASATHSFAGNGTPLEHCVIDGTNAALRSYLTARGGVIVVPRQPLQVGVKYAVSLNVNGAPYNWSFTVGELALEPKGWQSLGGSLTSGVGATSCSASNVDTFVLGGDGVPWRKTWNGTAWSGWTFVGGHVTSNPSAACQPTTTAVDLYTEGVDLALYHRFWNGSAWNAWENLGGSLTSGPGAVSCAAGTSDVFVLGGDGVIWRKSLRSGTWSGWNRVGGNVMGNPAVVCEPGTTKVHIFVEGTDHVLYHKVWDGTAYGPWDNLGGYLGSSPAASSCVAGKLDVFAMGNDKVLWRRGWTGTGWTAWQPVGGVWTYDPAAVCVAGGTVVDFFTRGPDATMWMGTATAT